jgi:hypothetical protein
VLRRDRPADVRYYVGSTGSGKTFRTARDIAAHRGPVLVWDWKDDHFGIDTARTLAELRARVVAGARALRYVPRYRAVEAQFDFFCRLAWARQVARPSDDLLLVVEELPEVTRPERAPEVWRRIINQGRVLGFSVIATTQRPALVDKSFTGAATLIASGRLGELIDARIVGQRINVDPVELQRLPDRVAYVFDGRTTRREEPKTGRRARAAHVT